MLGCEKKVKWRIHMQFTKCFVACAVIFCMLSTSLCKAENPNAFLQTTLADYVVVGVGTAGAVVAKKLSDDKKTSVIALHSGLNLSNTSLIKYSKYRLFTILAALLGSPLPFDPNTLNLPPQVIDQINAYLKTLPSPTEPLYETGVTVPQVFADNQELLWALALPEGGATSVNAGAWCIGTKQVYKQWEKIAGPEWSVDRILKTYKELEHYHGKTHHPHARGHHGPISVQQDPTPTDVAKKFTKAIIKGTGFPFVLDYNDQKTPIGVSSSLQITQHGHEGKFRTSSATAFLNEEVVTPYGIGVDGRKLRVLFDSTGMRTIWSGNKAIGVEYSQGGQIKQVFAKKGVIVCAGLKSSSFLLHSGVGPSALLSSLGIPVIFNNPNVGQGLADQPHIVMLYSTNPKDKVQNKYNSVFSQISWLPAPGSNNKARKVRFTTAGLIPGVAIALLDLVQPKSRGFITITSPDPLAPPAINLGVLSNPQDLALYRQAFTVYIKKINKALKEIDPKYQMIFPDPAILDDPVALTQFIQAEAGCNQHFQSHCRMAPLKHGGVVDNRGRVYGTKNLIVADNSIVPQCMDGSPMQTAYLIGYNIARLHGH